jgi:carboxymethylenebutenolidase
VTPTGEVVQIEADDGHLLSAYQTGNSDAEAAIVIVQEIFGVNAHIRAVVDDYAAMGYLAIAPAMFDRAVRGVDLDYTPESLQTGLGIRAQVDWATTPLDVAAAIGRVGQARPVAVVGYCFGGGVAWLAANRLPIQAAVCYYGGQIHDFIDVAPQCPTMAHFGELDAMIPLDHVAAIAAAHPDVEVRVYDGADHGFNCDIRDSYHPSSAALALQRTTEFLGLHLGA